MKYFWRMGMRNARFVLLLFLGLSFIASNSFATANKDEQHVLVAMRMIGHRVLLNSGDSISRVLPIEHEDDQYRIKFESEFTIKPKDLIATVDSVVAESQIAENYIVALEKCDNGAIVYSYEVMSLPESGMLPCGTRPQPRDCYSIVFTIVDPASLITDREGAEVADSKEGYLSKALLGGFLIGLVGLTFFFWNKKRSPSSNPDLILIGKYQFDRLNANLVHGDQKEDLTAKESDLLYLLYSSANQTLEREIILKNVWGDEGSYVGRTLDVFISKLRKKLELDSNIKIVNIRGVGYKLILNA